MRMVILMYLGQAEPPEYQPTATINYPQPAKR